MTKASSLTLIGLALVLVLALGVTRQYAAEIEAPPGCAAVFAATTRGGASAPRGGGCSLHGGRPGDTAVVRVIDGDTIVVKGDRHVRYIGIDTPEVRPVPEPFGPQATEYNEKLLRRGSVRLEKDESETDRFGRLLRYVYADGILVEAELVREGYARAVRYPPDLRSAVCLEALEEEARQAGRGMWSQ